MTSQNICPDCGIGQPHKDKCEDAERLSPLAVYVGEDDSPTERMTLRELSDYLRSLPQSVMDMPGTLIVHCSDGDISPVLATSQTEAELLLSRRKWRDGRSDPLGGRAHQPEVVVLEGRRLTENRVGLEEESLATDITPVQLLD